MFTYIHVNVTPVLIHVYMWFSETMGRLAQLCILHTNQQCFCWHCTVAVAQADRCSWGCADTQFDNPWLWQEIDLGVLCIKWKRAQCWIVHLYESQPFYSIPVRSFLPFPSLELLLGCCFCFLGSFWIHIQSACIVRLVDFCQGTLVTLEFWPDVLCLRLPGAQGPWQP